MKKIVSGLLVLGVLLIPSLVSARGNCYQEILREEYIPDYSGLSNGYIQVSSEWVSIPCHYPNAIYFSASFPPVVYHHYPYDEYYTDYYNPQYRYYGYDGGPVTLYKQRSCDDNFPGNTFFGALVGGAIGRAVSGDSDSSSGTVAGAIIGGSLAANLSCD
jgi:hypothetical protein